ncbi:MAG: DUF4062 domain-containing protein [Armatimonadetes bacterium]|nr:DUF4062 domain-containing protein [Armatimonadota bacterium]
MPKAFGVTRRTGGTHEADGDLRTIRVFVSSTFRDMAQERDELAKRVFPRIRRLCEERGVVFADVDLRWGVTDEEAAEGRVLPVCLAEIERSRPYFIGILGERYGWVPSEIPESLVESQPWLRQQEGRSITELEILHGVLDNPEMAGHALFYFRDPAWAAHQPERDVFVDASEQDRAKLAALKQRIRTSGFPLKEGFADPSTLADMVCADLTALIDRVFPPGSAPDTIERERREHIAFSRERGRHYLGRPEYYRELNEHLAGDGPPLVITGESGSGKSALVSSWLTGGGTAAGSGLDARNGVAGERLITFRHFAGLTAYSTDWEVVCRRAIAEIVRQTGVIIEAPSSATQLRSALKETLASAAAEARVLLVIDAVNQLEGEGARLGWLPEVFPSGVRVILSTLPGPGLDEMRRRGCRELEVQPLTEDERSLLISQYLGSFGKSLSAARTRSIGSSPRCASPLFLRTLLDELRVWGEHERLDEAIAQYLAAETIDDLFETVLARWERDYERDRPGLVGDAMRLVWASRHGVQEPELLDMLGDGGDPLPQAYFSPFSIAAVGAVSERAGLLTFAHDYMRIAVEDRYLTEASQKQAAHSVLADYFIRSGGTPRSVEELPHQLVATGDWERLYSVLADEAFVTALIDRGAAEARVAWQAVIRHTDHTLAEAYSDGLSDPAAGPDFAKKIAALMSSLGLKAEAARIAGDVAEQYLSQGKKMSAADALHRQASVIWEDEPDLALQLLDRAERVFRRRGALHKMIDCANVRGLIFMAKGDYDAALHYFRIFGAYVRLARQDELLEVSYNNQALCFARLGDQEAARAAREESLRLARRSGSTESIAGSLLNTVDDLVADGCLSQAFDRCQEAERLYREAGQMRGQERALGILATVQEQAGDAASVADARRQLDSLADDRARVLVAGGALGKAGEVRLERALSMLESGELGAGLQALDAALVNLREGGDANRIGSVLIRRADVLTDLGRVQEAIDEYRDGLSLLDESSKLRRGYAGRQLGRRLRDLKRDEEAVEVLTGSADSYEAGEAPADAADALRLAGLSCERLGKHDAALQHYRRAESLLHAAGSVFGEARILRYQGVLLDRKKAHSEALEVFKRAEDLFRTIDEPWGLAETLYRAGRAQARIGRHELAVGRFREAAEGFAGTRYSADFAKALRQLAWSLSATGADEEALAAARRAREAAERTEDSWELTVSTRVEAEMAFRAGETGAACDLYQRAVELGSEGSHDDELYWALMGLSRSLLSGEDLSRSREAAQSALQLADRHGWKRRMDDASNAVAKAQERMS